MTGAAYFIVIEAIALLLPVVNEVPDQFPATRVVAVPDRLAWRAIVDVDCDRPRVRESGRRLDASRNVAPRSGPAGLIAAMGASPGSHLPRTGSGHPERLVSVRGSLSMSRASKEPGASRNASARGRGI